MNTEFANFHEDIFTRLLPEGTKDETIQKPKTKRKISFRRIAGFILSSVSIFSYGAICYYSAKNISKTDLLKTICHEVMSVEEDAPAVSSVISEQTDTETQNDIEAESADSTELQNGVYPIMEKDLSSTDVHSLSNQTSFSPDTEALLAEAVSDSDVVTDYSVLIVHTHGTESFVDENAVTYDESTQFRTTDTSKNVVAVGDAVAEVLTEAGISVIHCREMFDMESYVDSYSRCAAAVVGYLEENPSIKYVLDIHRDAIFTEDSTLISPVGEDGTAQVMLVLGTSEMGADFPDWKDNLSFALRVQVNAVNKYPDLMRSINLRGPSFNEQLADRFLLVEIGSAGNTLSSSIEAGKRFAEAFAKTVLG